MKCIAAAVIVAVVVVGGYQYVPHKALAEVSKIGNLWERFVVVSHGWQGKSTDGSKSGWRQRSVFVVVVFIAVAM